MENPLGLRAHHLLCVHGFRGMGYSPGFVANLAEIVRRFREEPGLRIQVLRNLDAICTACPSNGGDICEQERRDGHIRAMDDRVIRKLGLKAGEIYDRDELVERTAARVRPDDLDILCRGCEWLSYGVCKEGIAALRLSRS
ncbi:MAG: DUF1284 domain-containing protein [Alicyclobacillaceae bacterium]|nr:DUF1284 domain-containing protein [Alicyclobacillaceae bacterium]